MKQEINWLICPHQSFRSNWILKSIKAKQKISYKNLWSSFVFDHLVERKMFLPEALRVLDLLSPVSAKIKTRIDSFSKNPHHHNAVEKSTVLKWPNTIATDIDLTIEPDLELRIQTQSRLKIKKPYIVIAPSSQWKTKRWTVSGFNELSRKLSHDGFNVYFVGHGEEVDHCFEIEKSVNDTSLRTEVRSLAGQTTLTELHGLLSEAEFVVANDSGPMHMAAVAGRPVVGIFGPTTLTLGYRPWANHSVVVQKDLGCRPCGKHGHNRCPIGTHDCMKKIEAREVYEATRQVKLLS